MNPRPCLLASVHSCVGLRLSKNARTGLDVSISLAVRNAWLCSVDHINSFLVLRRGRSGANRLATASVLLDSWLANPKKERRSVQLLGVGNWSIALVIHVDGWILYPLSDMMNLAKLTSLWAYCHFLVFSVTCFSSHRHKNCQTWSACCVVLLSDI